VEVYNDRLVGSEQRLESLFVQRMRVLTSLTKDEKIVDVDDSNSNTDVTENSSCCDSLESNFDTASNKDNIGVDTIFS
jgi:hypothetical protein